MRDWLARKVRGTRLEALGYEVDERLWQLRGLVRGSFSQHGEDRIILDYFHGRPGVYVDVGANYPIKISNTYLLYRHGWRGLTIEPIPRLSRRHRRLRPHDAHVNAAVASTPGEVTFYELENSGLSSLDREHIDAVLSKGGYVKREHKVPVRPLAELVPEFLGDQPVDLLSVDTEGYDLQVMQSANWERFHPRLVIFETNGEVALQASEFLRSKGYRLFREIGCNAIWERTDSLPKGITSARPVSLDQRAGNPVP